MFSSSGRRPSLNRVSGNRLSPYNKQLSTRKCGGRMCDRFKNSTIIVEDDKKFIFTTPPQRIHRCRKVTPFAISTVSVLQIIFYCASNNRLQRLLRFEPNKLWEAWRFFTYMFLHEDCVHLVLNVIMQLLFAYFLEVRHGSLRVLALYVAGGGTAVLGASCFAPDLVIGASGAVYALLISHVSDIIMNPEKLNHKVYRCVCIVIIVMSDTAYSMVHVFSKEEPLISWGAHVVGGVAGLFLGLVLFKQNEAGDRVRKGVVLWIAVVLYFVLLISLVALKVQITRCTPTEPIQPKYVYFC